MDEYATKVNAVFQRSMPLTMHKFHEMLNSRFILAAGDPSENRWGCMFARCTTHIYMHTYRMTHVYAIDTLWRGEKYGWQTSREYRQTFQPPPHLQSTGRWACKTALKKRKRTHELYKRRERVKRACNV